MSALPFQVFANRSGPPVAATLAKIDFHKHSLGLLIVALAANHKAPCPETASADPGRISARQRPALLRQIAQGPKVSGTVFAGSLSQVDVPTESHPQREKPTANGVGFFVF
jgi:hypothetical protein